MSPLEGFALMVSVLGGREYSRVTASERDGRGGLGYVSHGMLREGLSERWTGQQGKLEQRPEEAREGSVSPPPPPGGRGCQAKEAARAKVLVPRESGLLKRKPARG